LCYVCAKREDIDECMDGCIRNDITYATIKQSK